MNVNIIINKLQGIVNNNCYILSLMQVHKHAQIQSTIVERTHALQNKSDANNTYCAVHRKDVKTVFTWFIIMYLLSIESVNGMYVSVVDAQVHTTCTHVLEVSVVWLVVESTSLSTESTLLILSNNMFRD